MRWPIWCKKLLNEALVGPKSRISGSPTGMRGPGTGAEAVEFDEDEGPQAVISDIINNRENSLSGIRT